MITLTQSAANQITKIRQEQSIPETQKLRVSVVGGGCSGFSYSMAFEEAKPEDAEFTSTEINLIVDRKSLLYLMGIEIDFSDGLNGKGFTYANPNATRTCGCGTSFGV